MKPILTVTLNPSIDLSSSVVEMVPGPKLRLEAPQMDPGGGGINVARAIHILGGEATALVATAGVTGQQLLGLLSKEGVPVAPFEGPGETRQSLTVNDRSAPGRQYRMVMPGPAWSARTVRGALAAITEQAQRGGLVVLSGSQPPGVPDDFPAQLARRLARKGAALILDTSGAALHRAAGQPDTRLHALRMDQEEAEDLAGHPLPDRSASADFAQNLVRRGVAEMVIVARGADGSTLATQSARLHASGVDVPVKSRVGAGDSFLGAFTLGLAEGDDLGLALRKGSAAAASAVMTEATRLCTRRDARALVRRVALTTV